MLGIIVVPRNAVMIQEREHLFAALLTPFLVFVRQWGGEFSLTHRPQESHCRPLVSTHYNGHGMLRFCSSGQTMLPEWPSDDSSHSGGCWEEPGKQNPRSCRAQELARSRAQENERQKRKPTTSSTCEWRRGQSRVQEEVQCACNSHHTILSYIIFWKTERMAHTTKDKAKLLNRVRRIRGQVEAIERALDGEQECSSVLQLMAACRGALNGLMAEVLEGHIRFHVLDPKSGKNAPQVEAGEELIDVVRTYLK